MKNLVQVPEDFAGTSFPCFVEAPDENPVQPGFYGQVTQGVHEDDRVIRTSLPLHTRVRVIPTS